MLTISLAGLLLSGCTETSSVIVESAFPTMTPEQVEAMIEARQQWPVLDEFWVRFTKAWCKADNDPCE